MGTYTGRRTQTVTVWEKTGTDRYGEPTRGSPVEPLVRWERTRKDMMAPDGTRVNVDVVMVYGCDLDLKIEDVVYLGVLEDWVGTGSAGDDSELMKVVALDYVPNIRGDAAYREAGLVKYRDTLPEAT